MYHVKQLSINHLIYINMKNNQYNKEGKEEGYWEYYYNSKLASKGNYINGEKEGYWEYYFTNGKLMSKGNYINGKKEGYWEFYYTYGKLFKTEYFVI